MDTRFPTSSRIDKQLLPRAFALGVVLLLGLGILVTACGGTETTTTVAPATSTTEAGITTQAVSGTTAVVTTTQGVTTTAAVPTAQSVTTTTEPRTPTTVALAPMSACV